MGMNKEEFQAWKKKYYAEHPEKKEEQKRKAKEHFQRMKATNPEWYERRKEGYRNWRAKNKAKVDFQMSARRIKRVYGISMADYEKILQKQGGVCAICKEPERMVRKQHGTPKIQRLSVDHSRVSGKVRELLCSLCNPALGYAQENPKILQAMIAYLQKHSAQTQQEPNHYVGVGW